MARITASLLLVWALLLGPALCLGGLLEHACDCGEDIQCQHEESCADDPCASVTRPRDQDAGTALEFEASADPVASSIWVIQVCPAGRWWSSLPPPPPDRSNLPYAQSDRPLRV